MSASNKATKDSIITDYMKLKFTSVKDQRPGFIAALLKGRVLIKIRSLEITTQTVCNLQKTGRYHELALIKKSIF